MTGPTRGGPAASPEEPATEATPATEAIPVTEATSVAARPPVPDRPAPLPPPRVVPPGGTSSPATTVVPEAGARPAPPRAPLSRPVVPVRGRRARLALRRVDPWSVFVTTLLLSLFLAVVTVVAAFVLYLVLDMLGVPASVNKAATDVQGTGPVLTMGRFLGIGALIAAVDVVLLTALASIGAMLYNVCAGFTGGVEMTLAERD